MLGRNIRNLNVVAFVLVLATGVGCGNDRIMVNAQDRNIVSQSVSASSAIPVTSYSYRSTAATAVGSMKEISLCGVAKRFTGGAGLYRVESMTGATEDVSPGIRNGFTYVQLTRLEDWSGSAPERPVARIAGGPASPGVIRGWSVALEVGETVGLMFSPPRPDNSNYLGIHPLGLFKSKNGGFTNGQLFARTKVDAAALGKKLSDVTRGTCVKDELPEREVAPQQIPIPDPRIVDGPVPLREAPPPPSSHPTDTSTLPGAPSAEPNKEAVKVR